MTIAAQFFTSVFPILILFHDSGGQPGCGQAGGALNLPAETRSVLEDAIQGAGEAAFGIVGRVVVLASATSLSREP